MFQLWSVEQYRRLCHQEKWTLTEKVRAFARKTTRRLNQTQISEDGFNRQRREETLGRTKMVSNERSYAALVRNELISKVHRMQEIPWQAEPTPRSARLPPDAFTAKLKDCSLHDLNDIVSHTAGTAWYSPSAPLQVQPTADLDVSAALMAEDAWDKADKLWLSCLMQGHSIAIRKKS